MSNHYTNIEEKKAVEKVIAMESKQDTCSHVLYIPGTDIKNMFCPKCSKRLIEKK